MKDCVIMMTPGCWKIVNNLATSLGYKIPYTKKDGVIMIEPNSMSSMAAEASVYLSMVGTKKRDQIRSSVGPVLKILLGAVDVE